MTCNIPARTLWAAREGTISAPISLEWPDTPTTVHSFLTCLNPTGIGTSGGHKSHRANSPGRYQVHWAGSGDTNNGRS